MTVSNSLDNSVIEQQLGVVGALHVQFAKRLRAKGRIGRDGRALAFRQREERRLREVGVMFDLKRCGHDFGVAHEIEDQGPVEVADADAAAEFGLDQFFHCRPGFLDRRRAWHHGRFAVVGEARRVAVRRVDVLQGDGEVHNV